MTGTIKKCCDKIFFPCRPALAVKRILIGKPGLQVLQLAGRRADAEAETTTGNSNWNDSRKQEGTEYKHDVTPGSCRDKMTN